MELQKKQQRVHPLNQSVMVSCWLLGDKTDMTLSVGEAFKYPSIKEI